MKRFPSLFLLLPLCIVLSACTHLKIGYEFNTGQSFASIQGTYSEKTSASYKGYMYYFDSSPDNPSIPWSMATLRSPVPINGSLVASQCWNQKEGFQRVLNFYCGGEASSPAAPPAGTYQVIATDSTFTFDGVTSKAIEADLSNIYVPAVMLTMSGGKVTRIDWKWWKKVGSGWVNPTDGELSGALQNAGFEIGQANWAGDPSSSRVGGSLGLTSTGSVAPPSQGFTPGVVRIYFSDKSGYNYGFEWR